MTTFLNNFVCFSQIKVKKLRNLKVFNKNMYLKYNNP